jgi:hypothetical protein
MSIMMSRANGSPDPDGTSISRFRPLNDDDVDPEGGPSIVDRTGLHVLFRCVQSPFYEMLPEEGMQLETPRRKEFHVMTQFYGNSGLHVNRQVAFRESKFD